MEIEESIREKMRPVLDRSRESLAGVLGLQYRVLSKACVVASLPVNEKTKQPFGLLHGGASVALAESLASIGAWLNVDESRYHVVGIEINANHVRSVRDGAIVGTALPLHMGKSTHVWEVKIVSEPGDALVCVSRCTLGVIEKRGN